MSKVERGFSKCLDTEMQGHEAREAVGSEKLYGQTAKGLHSVLRNHTEFSSEALGKL